jgi:hypothetical protein
VDHRAGRRALVAAGAVAVVGAGLAGSAAFAGVLPSKSVDAVCGSSADVGQIAVAADSASDAWAIGSCNGEYVIEHWDGAHWALGPLTGVRQSTALTGVAATSAANVWVVGYEANTYRALVEHWNGSTWTAVDANRFAGAARGETELNAVSATTSGGTWAVGILCCPRGLIEHWNGSRMAASPDRALPRIAQSGFFGVAATSPRDVWAVGNSNARHFHALSERWNGRRWKAERAPGAYELYGVASTSPTNAWAVGSGGSASSGGGVVEHWNGIRWSEQAKAALPLQAISASSPTNAWAVGGFAGRGVIEHWDGMRWSVQAKPPVELQSVAAVSANDAWALGGETLMHWNGHAWARSG